MIVMDAARGLTSIVKNKSLNTIWCIIPPAKVRTGRLETFIEDEVDPSAFARSELGLATF